MPGLLMDKDTACLQLQKLNSVDGGSVWDHITELVQQVCSASLVIDWCNWYTTCSYL